MAIKALSVALAPSPKTGCRQVTSPVSVSATRTFIRGSALSVIATHCPKTVGVVPEARLV